MKPPPFAYYDPTSVDEAVSLRAEHEFDSLILAGGQSLVPMLNIRLARPEVLIDINRIEDLQRVRTTDTHIEFGATVRQHHLEVDPVVREKLPLLPEMVRYIGHVENRHRGTIGGSLAHADSAAELPTAAVTMDAEMVIAGPSGVRVEAAQDFFAGWMSTTVNGDELLVAVRFPIPRAGTGYGFVEVARRDGDFALAAAAAQLTLDGSGRIASAAIGVASITDRPVRARAVEQQLIGVLPTRASVREAAAAIVDEVTASDDMHATHAYRKHLATVVTARAVNAAVTRAS